MLLTVQSYRAPDKVHIFNSLMPISTPDPIFDPLLESSHRDDSNRWSNIGFGEEITQEVWFKDNFSHFTWSSELSYMHFFAIFSLKLFDSHYATLLYGDVNPHGKNTNLYLRLCDKGNNCQSNTCQNIAKYSTFVCRKTLKLLQ